LGRISSGTLAEFDKVLITERWIPMSIHAAWAMDLAIPWCRRDNSGSITSSSRLAETFVVALADAPNNIPIGDLARFATIGSRKTATTFINPTLFGGVVRPHQEHMLARQESAGSAMASLFYGRKWIARNARDTSLTTPTRRRSLSLSDMGIRWKFSDSTFSVHAHN
jgi:hypothetical protein